MNRNKIKNNLAAAPLQHAASIVDAFRIDEELTRFESIIVTRLSRARARTKGVDIVHLNQRYTTPDRNSKYRV